MRTTIKRLSCLVPALLVVWTTLPSTASAASPIKVETLSTKADRVTGSEVLVAVTVPPRVAPKRLGFRLNGRGAKGFLSADPDNPRRLTGLVTGLRDGSNRFTAWAPGLNRATSLRVYNSPITGPVFSGPHQSPYICRTEQNGLGEPTDDDCSAAATTTEYFYGTTSGEIEPLADPGLRPPDLDQTTLSDGRTVDYIVRMESGTINRAIYRWAMLVPGGEQDDGWNGRFVYSHGGGCTAGYQQGKSDTKLVLDDQYLKRGYAVLTSSLNVMATACNDVLSAESASMVKEYVTEKLGKPPVWTIGVGGSGGSMLIQMTAQNYPGLFDGVLPTASYPDNVLVIQPHCRLLYNYFDSPEGAGLNASQRTSITGIPVENSCRGLGGTTANVINVFDGCSAAVPLEIRFDAVTNPSGARCTVFDSLVNVYGRDPATGYARRIMDNVGRQYGLEALQEGDITIDEFLDLNEYIGGFDNDGVLVPERAVADDEALEIAHRTGRVNRAAGGAAGVAFIDVRSYVDNVTNVHVSVPAFEFKERLRQTLGSTDNYVMFRARGQANVSPMREEALDAMAEWLDRVEADTTASTVAAKVASNRPDRATDACWANDGQRYNEPAELGAPGVCNDTYPPFSTPDLRAGKPVGSNVIKCQLKTPNPADYGSPDPAEIARFQTIFPEGICDWDQPGVGDVPLEGTDISYGPDHATPSVKRKLFIKVRPKTVRKSRRGKTVRVTASLYPCPEVAWQRVKFERKVKRSNKPTWKKAGSKLVRGNNCRASIRVRKIRKRTTLRARSEAESGFLRIRSRAKTVRVRR